MSRCRLVQHLFSAYIDGDLSPVRARRVEVHLARCPACSRELDQWRGMLRLVSYHAAVACPIDCAEAVLLRLEARHQDVPPPGYLPVPRRPLVPRLALTLAAAALLGVAWFGTTHAGWRFAQSAAGHGTGGAPADRVVTWIAGRPGDRAMETGANRVGPAMPADYSPSPAEALRAHAPDRLQHAFGRSDSLILAADFVEDDR
jgi:anti-sigma factor RsiW